MAVKDHLREEFLNDLFKLIFRRKDVLQMCIKHLEFHYIPVEAYKSIWKDVKEFFISNGTIPSIGSISQMHSTSSKSDARIREVLTEIKETPTPNKQDTIDLLNDFIKDSMSLEFFNEFVDNYERGDRSGAQKVLIKSADKLSNFSVSKGHNYYEKVYDGFEDRHERRIESGYIGDGDRRVPFGIDKIDELTDGGSLETELFGMLARSGAGKTKWLRHQGITASRRGFNVLHIQAEGSKSSCEDGYDATWTAVMTSDIRRGSIDSDKYQDLKKIVRNMRAKGSDIYIHAFEQFNSASMQDVRMVLADVMNYHAKIDLVLIDYLELLDPADGRKYNMNEERFRRLAIANQMKNLCLENGTRIGTATQANDIQPKLLQDPSYVMTRHNVSECKGLVNPFDYFFTFNQTDDEYADDFARIYIDKFRFFEGRQVIPIFQKYDNDRFYDRKRTINDMEEYLAKLED